VKASMRLRELVSAEIAAAGKTQTQVAEELGISQKHVSQTLIGHVGLSVNLAERMLAVCGRVLVLGTEPLGEA
jgi:predicted transcriptional regulator